MALLEDIEEWKYHGASDDDVVCRLRLRTVPSGYAYSMWTKGSCSSYVIFFWFTLTHLCHAGKEETTVEQLRSILAQLHFTYEVCHYHDDLGVPFKHHLYVPETHPITNLTFSEREDEGHVLKV